MQVPNGEQTFLDENGDPLSGGQVFMYVPGTTTPSTTWTDPSFSAVNTNPIVLDKAGRCTIWGPWQQFRQVVIDQFGITQWDVLTGQAPVFDDLTVTGHASLNSVSAEDITAAFLNVTGGASIASLGVTGPATFAGPVAADAGINIAGTLNVAGDQSVSGFIHAQGLNVSGDIHADGNIEAAGLLYAGGNVQVAGPNIVIANPNSPGIVINNTADPQIWKIEVLGNMLDFGLSDGGNITDNLMYLNTVGDLAARDFIPYSDVRLKENITNLPDCLPQVLRTHPRSFKFKGSEGLHRGFIAQDFGRRDGVSLSELVATLWKAVQELGGEVAELRRRLDGD